MTMNNNAARRIPKTSGGVDKPNAQIASKLRALYTSVQEEAIPDRLMDLLEKLDAAELNAGRPVRD